MKNRIALFCLILVILSSSCVTRRKCLQKFPPTTTRDSIYVETIKEVPVLIPGDTVKVEIPINCPDQDLVNIETSRLIQQIKILNGKLISNTLIKPDTVFVHSKETKTVIKEVKVPEPVKYIPKIYKQAMMICIIIFAAAFIFFGYKLYKFFKP